MEIPGNGIDGIDSSLTDLVKFGTVFYFQWETQGMTWNCLEVTE